MNCEATFEDMTVEARNIGSRVELLRSGEKDAAMIRDMQKEAFAGLLEKYQDHDTSPANESLERITWKLRTDVSSRPR